MATRGEHRETASTNSPLNDLLDVVVVDTDVMSYVFKKDTRGALYNPHLAGKCLMISFVTFGELQRWAIRNNWGISRRQILEAYLSPVLVFHSDDDLCIQWAKITEDGKRRGHQIQPGDGWIAATALLHGVPLITHNRRDFDNVSGLTVISESLVSSPARN